ncbi:unnamed protein product [Miscanthus lutarioriparius]|uniref:Uncharacterized protein n=1 Tax=Miscanthus lutarioriparius TaxID=422564 RepID=A0A811RY35_9POAL|nr:unnamed protein product [Miscanthus lutarioriparius]
MDKILIIVSAVVGSLGVLSAIFGFSAEGTKLTPYNILVFGDECIYPQNPALGLGICAAIFLLAAQVTFTAVGGCCGCCNKSRSNPSETKRIVGIVCAVVSWIAAVIAWVLLIEGAVWNENVVRMTAPNCYYLKDGIFAGAGVLSLAATALGVTSYVLMRTKRVKAAAAPPVVPAEGEPKLPPAATQGNNGSPRNEELQRPPAVPPPAMASAPPEPAGEPTPPGGAEMAQQPPVQLPQAVGVPNENETIQYPIQQGSSEDLIRKELTKGRD